MLIKSVQQDGPNPAVDNRNDCNFINVNVIIDLDVYLKGTVTERSSIHWWTPQMATTARSQKLRSGLLCGCTASQAHQQGAGWEAE